MQDSFEGVLIWKERVVYILLYFFKTSDQVNRRLLIARWRVFKIFQVALKLESIVIIFEKSTRDGGIEWYAGKTVVDLFSVKDSICAVVNGESLRKDTAQRIPSEFTI